jgi:dTDP-4-dehydrorhamnose 3,5-epimerase
MNTSVTSISGPMVLKPKRFGDARGWFSESWNQKTFARSTGVLCDFVQDNFAHSAQRGTLRGLHFQVPPAAQGKLIQVVRGSVFDVIVDLRRDSATFGRHHAENLTASGGEQLWVPEGFAHGYCTLEDDTLVFYKVTAFYDPAADRGLAFDDPALGIDWPVPSAAATLSERDRRHPVLADLPDIDWTLR